MNVFLQQVSRYRLWWHFGWRQQRGRRWRTSSGIRGNKKPLLWLLCTVHPCISKSIFFVSSIWGRKWTVLLRITCQKWSQICHTTSGRCLDRAHKYLASLCDSAIFLGIFPSEVFFPYQLVSRLWSSIWGRKCKVLLRITCHKWSQIYHTTSRKRLNRAHKGSRKGCRSP